MSEQPAPRALALLLPSLLLVASYLLLRDLGGPMLWEDEGDTAVFARNIAEFGLPRAWDGRVFTDSDWGERVAPRLFGTDFVLVGTPWLPFYAVAGSFLVLGESAWSARLPFALAGLATVVLLYRLVRRATGDPRAALAAAVVLVCSAQFLLYARECRHYAFSMLLSVAVLLCFLRLRDHPREKWLVVAAALLFHTQILPAATVVGACGALTLIHPGFRELRRPFWRCVPAIVLLTAPWLPIAWQAFGANWMPAAGARDLALRAGQFAIESTVAIPVIGWLVLAPIAWRAGSARDREWLLLAGAVVAACLVLVPWTLTPQVLITVGIRYVPGLLPIAAGATGLVVARAGRGGAAFAALLALFAATHVPGNALFSLAMGESGRIPGTRLYLGVPLRSGGKFLDGELWAFARELGVPNPGTTSRIAALLTERASPGDSVVTNYAWDNLYFHTNLVQGLRLPPTSPLHDAARAAGLPAYVYEPDRPDWLVWRSALDPIGAYGFDDLRALYAAAGARIETVATLPDTTWENRPELASHRFARDGFLFAPAKVGPFPALPHTATVLRLRWPEGTRRD